LAVLLVIGGLPSTSAAQNVGLRGRADR